MSAPTDVAEADYLGRSLTVRVKLGLVALVLAPLLCVGGMWLLVALTGWVIGEGVLFATAAALVIGGQAGTVLYGRRHGVDRFWIAAVVLAGVVATAGWAVGSGALVLAIVCASDCG